MPSCVESVEAHTLDLLNVASDTSDLGKSQTLANCIVIGSSNQAGNIDGNNDVAVEFDLTASPDKVVAERGFLTNFAKDVTAFVTEFNSAEVRVRKYTVDLTGASVTQTLDESVVLANTWIWAAWRSTDTSDDFEQILLRYRFQDVDTAEFFRDTATGTVTITFWTCEAIGGTKCWEVQHLTKILGNTDTALDLTIPSSVVVGRSFVISTYEVNEGSDEVADGVWNVGLDTGSNPSTNVLMRRGNGASPVAVGEAYVQVIELASGFGTVQHGEYNYGAGVTATGALSPDIDQARAIVMSPNQQGWCEGDGTSSAAKAAALAIQGFNSNSEVQGTRGRTTGNCTQFWQVIEWELPGAPAAGADHGPFAAINQRRMTGLIQR